MVLAHVSASQTISVAQNPGLSGSSELITATAPSSHMANIIIATSAQSQEVASGISSVQYDAYGFTPGSYNAIGCDEITNLCSLPKSFAMFGMVIPQNPDLQGGTDPITFTVPSGDTANVEIIAIGQTPVYSGGATSTQYDAKALSVGSYSITGCDTTLSECLSPFSFVVLGLSISSNPGLPGTSDPITVTVPTGDTANVMVTNSLGFYNSMASGPSTATFDAKSLASGTYYVEACDSTLGVCSTPQALVMLGISISQSPGLVGMTDPIYFSVTPGDTANIMVSNSVGTFTLTHGKSAVEYDAGLLPIGDYQVVGCDEATSQCTSPVPLVMMSVNIAINPGISGGNPDPITATVASGDSVTVTVSNAVWSKQVASGTTTATYDASLLNPGTYGVVVCDTSQSACEAPISLTMLDQIQATIINTFPIVIIALLLSFSIVALAYLLGEMLNISALKGWYKGELWESTKTVIIIATIYAIIVVLGAAAVAIAGGTATYNPSKDIFALFTSADNYLGIQLNNANNALGAYAGAFEAIASLGTITFQTYIPIPIVLPYVGFIGTVNFGSNENIYQSNAFGIDLLTPTPSLIKDNLQLLVLPMTMALSALVIAFPYIVDVGLGIFLPMGVIFRAIPFMRGIGGTLIALAITVSIAFPATLVFNNMVWNYMVGAQNLTTSGASCSNVFGGLVGSLICGFFNDLFSFLANPISSIVGAPSLFNSGYAAAYGNQLSVFGSSYVMLNVLTEYPFPLMVQFILFILDIVLLVALAQGVAKILGGSIRLGIGKMKLA
jgi:hypothetical protein